MRTFLKPDYENNIILSREFDYVVGIDEAGRGCFAGPVAVGSYLLTSTSQIFEGITDSKLLSKPKRESLHKNLSTHRYVVKYGEVVDIDKIGIGKVIENLVTELVKFYLQEYISSNILFLIDGQFSKNFGPNTRKIVKGDSTYYSIAAASILAKVERDYLMNNLHDTYPEYGFDHHKGYGTREHIENIKKYGKTNIHRNSFIHF